MKNLNDKIKIKNINDKLMLSKQKLTEIPFRKIAPNMVTMMALCSGVTSIRYSIAENWTKAVLCIFLAALFDGLDGRVARFLKASSKFGAELDSLSDFVSFGVAPAILIYQWSLFDLPKFGWLFCLIFAMGMAMRLARFNTMLDATNAPEYWSHYFVGVPAPAAAALGIMPVLISFDFPEVEFILRSNAFCAVMMILVAFLMVSRIPTISLKKTKVHQSMFMPLMLVVVLFINFMLIQPWLTLGVMTLLYLLSIPIVALRFTRDKKAFENKKKAV
ncbi:MAG: CDP-diacylglycerol--serine O-phosphatidyltransferase [Alphaproteobacteria bacterium]|nr:CDP-diacylglycerol--serine O-phosphatidyltransferase [Alphaproteobacteria bacterium]